VKNTFVKLRGASLAALGLLTLGGVLLLLQRPPVQAQSPGISLASLLALADSIDARVTVLETHPTLIPGPAGTKGDTGPAGIPGPAGPKGDTGPVGPQGPQGETGLTGPQGPTGDAGLAGAAGPVGPQGIQGAQGLPGAPGQGSAGPFTVTGTPGSPDALVTLSGYNLRIVSGSGSTSDGTVDSGNNPIPGTALTGLGNVIIGYNALRGDNTDDRTGSHNLIVGDQNTYSSFGGLAIGVNHTLSGPYASITGGYGNVASGFAASVSGGQGNAAQGQGASISGGASNQASGFCSSVSGGYNNSASGGFSSVSGGLSNTASGAFSSIGGGFNLTMSRLVGWAAGSQGSTHYNGKYLSQGDPYPYH